MWHSRRRTRARRGQRQRHVAPRRGVALLAALALLALSSALLAGSFAAARATTRSARAALLTARVETGARRALGEVVSAWSAAFDTLAVGAAAEPALGVDSGDARLPLVRRARVARIGERLFVVSVEVRAYAWSAAVARRRTRLVLQRPPDDTTGIPQRPVPIPRWSMADVY